MESKTLRFVPTKMIVGAFIALLGLILTLDNLSVIDAEGAMRFWSLFLVAIGLKFLLEGRVVGGIAWTFIGSWILLYNLEIISWEIWDLWPVVLIGLGVVLVRQALAPAQPAEDSSSSNRTSAVAVLCSARKGDSKPFRGGSATAVLGAAVFDLRKAEMEGNEAYFDAFACMGSVEIIVPENWKVTSEVLPFMGGFEDKSEPNADATKRLHVRGAAFMGGVEVRN